MFVQQLLRSFNPPKNPQQHYRPKSDNTGYLQRNAFGEPKTSPRVVRWMNTWILAGFEGHDDPNCLILFAGEYNCGVKTTTHDKQWDYIDMNYKCVCIYIIIYMFIHLWWLMLPDYHDSHLLKVYLKQKGQWKNHVIGCHRFFMPQTCGNLRHGSPKNLYVCFKWMQNPHVFFEQSRFVDPKTGECRTYKNFLSLTWAVWQGI